MEVIRVRLILIYFQRATNLECGDVSPLSSTRQVALSQSADVSAQSKL